LTNGLARLRIPVDRAGKKAIKFISNLQTLDQPGGANARAILLRSIANSLEFAGEKKKSNLGESGAGPA